MFSYKSLKKVLSSKENSQQARYETLNRSSFLPYKEEASLTDSVDGESTHSKELMANDYDYRLKLTLTRFVVYSVFAVTIGIFLGVLGSYLTLDGRALSPKSPIKEFAPQMPLTTITFEKIPELYGAPSRETDRYWDSLVPEGKGFVQIPNPEDYDLEPGILTKTAVERYSVAMYHELHCLALLRRYYWHLIDASSNGWPTESREEMVREQLGNHHPQHCFAYLAQAIMCNADLTIEWARVEPDGRRYQVEGWGVPHHTCKDPKAVRDWAEKHHSPARPNSTHIDGSKG